MDLKFTTKTGAIDRHEKIINAKLRVGGVGLARKEAPGGTRSGSQQHLGRFSYLGSRKRKTSRKRIRWGNGKS